MIRLIVLALVALLAFPLAVMAQDPPAPDPHIEKANNGPVDVGGVGIFTIAVVNTGNASLGAVEVIDALPGLERGAHWGILSGYSFDTCGIASNVLSCFKENLPGKHLEEQDNGEVLLVNGEAVVQVWAVLSVCGSYVNDAAMIVGQEVETTRSVLTVTCPATPTPTNTPTATATPTSTATPTQTATQTPVVITATPTPKFGPNNPAPGPPDTGTGTAETKSHAALLLFASLGLGALAFGIGGVAIARRSRDA